MSKVKRSVLLLALFAAIVLGGRAAYAVARDQFAEFWTVFVWQGLQLKSLVGPASLVVDSGGNVGIGARQPVDSMHFYVDSYNGITTNAWLVPGPSSGGAGVAQQSATAPPETRLGATPVAVRLLVHNIGTPPLGCDTTFAVSKNGSPVVASALSVTHSTANNTFQDSGVVSVAAASTDSWGVALASAPSNAVSCKLARLRDRVLLRELTSNHSGRPPASPSAWTAGATTAQIRRWNQ